MSHVPRISTAEPARILLVDDEKTVCRTLALIFEANHYEVRQAQSADEALQLLIDWTPSLAILDVNLPKMNGVDLARLILKRNPNCRVLLFSGRPETSEIIDKMGKEAEMFKIVAKPIAPRVLLEWARGGSMEQAES